MSLYNVIYNLIVKVRGGDTWVRPSDWPYVGRYPTAKELQNRMLKLDLLRAEKIDNMNRAEA